MFFSRKKRHSSSNSSPTTELGSSQQLQFPTKTGNVQSQPQSRLESPKEKHLSQPVYPWSTHAPQSGQSPSPFPRDSYAFSTNVTAAGELFLFGGYAHRSDSLSNDLYAISTRDFSATLLQTGGDIPSPRFAHRAVFIQSTNTILIWGGETKLNLNAQTQGNDDPFYLLDLASREWTRIAVNGPGPGARYYHTMTLVGSKLFVFGGKSSKRYLNDIWAFDLNCLKSNPSWESYEPAAGSKMPHPRACHVSMSTGDRIIVFGGCGDLRDFNDTWSFNISTRKWTELQCTGSIPVPRRSHAAVLIDDVMYVHGGRTVDGTYLGDLTALNLSTQQWTAFQLIGPSPCGRRAHSMASDGRRIFVFGGALSPGTNWQADGAELIYVLDTKLLIYPKPDSNTVEHDEKTTQLAQNLSAGLTQGRPQHGVVPSSDAGAPHAALSFQIPTSEDMGRPASSQIARERNPSLDRLPSRPAGARGRPRRVPDQDDHGERSKENPEKLVAPDAPSGKEFAQLEHGRLVELERQLSETLTAKTERDRRIAQLTDELLLKCVLLEHAEANAAEEKKRARLEQRKLQAKFDELLLSHSQAEANAVEEKDRAGLELREVQAKLDESLLYHKQAEASAAEEKKRAGQELRELQAKLDESLLSRNYALEQAQAALQKAARAAEVSERSQRELAEVHAKLEARESELAAFRSRPAETENGWAKSKAGSEEDSYRNQNATGPANTDEDKVVHRLMERVQAMEAEMASMRWNEKSFEMMECRNEG